jgi:hypothetical protein
MIKTLWKVNHVNVTDNEAMQLLYEYTRQTNSYCKYIKVEIMGNYCN